MNRQCQASGMQIGKCKNITSKQPVLNGQNQDGSNTNQNQMKKNTHPLYIRLFQKKKQTGGVDDMEFPGVSKK